MRTPGVLYILFTSCKGGVGKSTLAANIAFSLARRGKRTLLCDFNFDMRCLDLLLGAEDRVIFDLGDAASGRVPVTKCILTDERCGDLFFLAAPFKDGHKLTSDDISAVLMTAVDALELECVIIDTPGTLVSSAITGTGLITDACVVASHQPSSIRAADTTGLHLESCGIKNARLIINSFDAEAVLKGSRPGINEIIDRAYLPLTGIVPYDRALMLAAEGGRLAAELKGSENTARAIDNTAARLLGCWVPLFDGFTGRKARRTVKRLLG